MTEETRPSGDDELLQTVMDFVSMITDIGTYGKDPEARSRYMGIRERLIKDSLTASRVPHFIRSSRNPDDLRRVCQEKGGYAERRKFIKDEFEPLLFFLEEASLAPGDEDTAELLRSFNEESVHRIWQKALDRRATDPEGAITSARTLLESVCKHILTKRGIRFESGWDLPKLYRESAKTLKLSAEKNQDETIRSIFGSVANIIKGIGTLRNQSGDAHASDPGVIRADSRHAKLAVNLAGTVATFLVESFSED